MPAAKPPPTGNDNRNSRAEGSRDNPPATPSDPRYQPYPSRPPSRAPSRATSPAARRPTRSRSVNPTGADSDSDSDPNDLYADPTVRLPNLGSSPAPEAPMPVDPPVPNNQEQAILDAIAIAKRGIAGGAATDEHVGTWAAAARDIMKAIREGMAVTMNNMTSHSEEMGNLINEICSFADENAHLMDVQEQPFLPYNQYPATVAPPGWTTHHASSKKTHEMLQEVLARLTPPGASAPSPVPPTQTAVDPTPAIHRMSSQISAMQERLNNFTKQFKVPNSANNAPSTPSSSLPPRPSTPSTQPPATQSSTPSQPLPTQPPNARPTMAQAAAAGVPPSTGSKSDPEAWSMVGPAKKKAAPLTELCYILQFPDGGVDKSERHTPAHIVTKVNEVLQNDPIANKLRLIGAQWTMQGHCKLFFPRNTSRQAITNAEYLFKPIISADRFATLSVDEKWSKVVFKNASTRQHPGAPPFPMNLYKEDLLANSFVKDLKLEITQQPFFVRKDAAANSDTAELVFAFRDPDGSKVKTLLSSYRFGFIRGSRAYMRKWNEKATLRQCVDGCWMLGHTKKSCKHPTKYCCKDCGKSCRDLAEASHHRGHCTECKKEKNEAPTCPHPKKCLVCTGEGHSADDPACPSRRRFRTPASDEATKQSNSSRPTDAMDT
jgi:hypothetical protein